MTRAIIRPSRNPDEMRLFRSILFPLALTFLLAWPSFAADPFADAAGQFARQIASRVGASAPISITARNLSSVGESQFAEIRRTLQTQLRSQGLRIVPATQSGATAVQITLSENVQSYLWVAEIRKADNQQVEIVPIPRPQATVATPNTAMFTLRKTPLWVQDQPVLDLAALDKGGGTTHLLVLEPTRVALYSVQGSRQELQRSQPITRTGPLPRDLRGRLVLGKDHAFDAYLPGMHCSSAGQGAVEMTCVASDDPWPLDASLNAFFAPARNFFTGVLSGTTAQGKSTAPFFSAARVGDGGSVLWVLAGVDGRIRLFNGINESLADFPGWGSDLAGVKTACGSGSQVLATRGTDETTPDAVQAFELGAREPMAVTVPVEFPGPVVALWPAEGGGAIAVSHNLKTGRYEAFGLTITCER